MAQKLHTRTPRLRLMPSPILSLWLRPGLGTEGAVGVGVAAIGRFVEDERVVVGGGIAVGTAIGSLVEDERVVGGGCIAVGKM